MYTCLASVNLWILTSPFTTFLLLVIKNMANLVFDVATDSDLKRPLHTTEEWESGIGGSRKHRTY